MGTVRRAFRCIPSVLPRDERAAGGTGAQGSAGRMGIHLVSGAALWRVPRSGATGLRASSSARELGSRDDSPAWDGLVFCPWVDLLPHWPVPRLWGARRRLGRGNHLLRRLDPVHGGRFAAKLACLVRATLSRW